MLSSDYVTFYLKRKCEKWKLIFIIEDGEIFYLKEKITWSLL